MERSLAISTVHHAAAAPARPGPDRAGSQASLHVLRQDFQCLDGPPGERVVGVSRHVKLSLNYRY